MQSISSFLNTVKRDVRTSLKSNRRKSADSLWRNTNDLLPAETDDKAASTVEKREVPGKVGGALSIAGPQRFVWKQFSCHCFRHTAHSLQRVETSYALAPCASILPAARSFFYFCSAGNGARPARYAPRIISEPLPRQETCRPVASGLCRCGALFEMLYS